MQDNLADPHKEKADHTLHKQEKRADRPYQAFRILQFAFAFIPIVAGLDKFAYLLTDWSQYLSGEYATLAQGNKALFMYIVGIIEIIVGIGMIFKPKYFAYIVAIWIALIVINLFIHKHFYDVALRDIGLCLSAIALGQLSLKYSR